jgi:7-carboxy-7-deazaguanine synthase
MNESFLNTVFNISEIFYSIQGESTLAGLPCVFVRLQGCELRCKWCDTPYALEIKQIEKQMSAREIINEINKYQCNYVCFTGGEPLLQKEIINLINHLAKIDYKISIETNGHQDISKLNDKVIKVMDLKAPSSGMVNYNKFENLNYLTHNDEIKIVINDKTDYLWAREIISKYKLDKTVKTVILTPVSGELSAKELAEWVLADKLPVRVLLQLHKYIWESDKRGI